MGHKSPNEFKELNNCARTKHSLFLVMDKFPQCLHIHKTLSTNA